MVRCYFIIDYVDVFVGWMVLVSACDTLRNSSSSATFGYPESTQLHTVTPSVTQSDTLTHYCTAEFVAIMKVFQYYLQLNEASTFHKPSVCCSSQLVIESDFYRH